jgi:hypothetical protein
MTEQLKTLKEIAPIFKRSPKAFSKFVRENNVPHFVVGRSMLFDLKKVEAYLEARSVVQNVVEMSAVVRKSQQPKSRFAEECGI